MKKIMISLVFAFMLLIVPANALALSGHLPFEPNFEFQRILNPDLLRKSANDYIKQEFGRESYFGEYNYPVDPLDAKPFNTNSDIIARYMVLLMAM